MLLNLDKLQNEKPIDAQYIDLNDRPLVIFGAGVAGKTLIERLSVNNIIPDYIIDESPNINTLKNVAVINPDKCEIENEVKQHARVIIAVIPECSSVTYQYDDLVQKLKNWGFRNLFRIDFYYFQIEPILSNGTQPKWYYFDPGMNEIFVRNHQIISAALRDKQELLTEVYHLLEDQLSQDVFRAGISFFHQGNQALKIKSVPEHQYFIPELFDLGNIKIAIDAGAYTGDTLLRMISICPNLQRVYCFEPSPAEYHQLVKCRSQGKMEIFSLMAGLGDKTGIGNFVQDIHKTYKSTNPEATSAMTPIVALDEFMHGASPDFIKMDIEGAEKDALKGAQRIIKKYQPLLAICIYHHPADLWEIPKIIYNLDVPYRYYLRRHSLFSWNETILYAIPDRLK